MLRADKARYHKWPKALNTSFFVPYSDGATFFFLTGSTKKKEIIFGNSIKGRYS